jgi:hypothetical protein
MTSLVPWMLSLKMSGGVQNSAPTEAQRITKEILGSACLRVARALRSVMSDIRPQPRKSRPIRPLYQAPNLAFLGLQAKGLKAMLISNLRRLLQWFSGPLIDCPQGVSGL